MKASSLLKSENFRSLDLVCKDTSKIRSSILLPLHWKSKLSPNEVWSEASFPSSGRLFVSGLAYITINVEETNKIGIKILMTDLDEIKSRN